MEQVQTYFENFTRNLTGSFTRLKPEGWIRLVWIVGAYLLLRPYLMKLGARQQQKQHEAAGAENEPTGAEVHPNELRGGKKAKVTIPGADSDDEETTEAKPGDWGKKARVKQRKFIREVMEKEEAKRLADEEQEDLKDIAHLLED